MADWPDTEELKQVLNVGDAENANTDWDPILDRVMAAAIQWVKSTVGDWDELVDEPDESLAQAALRMGELMAERETNPGATVVMGENDPTIARLLTGHRRRFGFA